jgi:hypothetical protein
MRRGLSKPMSKVCYNCGQPATTKEHIPPKCLFPKGTRSQLITVPACSQCNEQMAMDDQYFATVLTSRRNDNPTQSVVWQQKVLPQLNDEEFDGLRKRLLASARPIWLPDGDEFVQTGILKLDMERLNRALYKTIRGLYYHHRGSPLPTTDTVRVFLEPKDWLPELANRAREYVIVQPGVFEYRCAFVTPDSSLSGWWLLFYSSVIAVGFTVPANLAHKVSPTKLVSS